MSEHPIQGLMMTAMNSIKEMIDKNVYKNFLLGHNSNNK